MQKDERGYALVMFLVLMALGALLASGSLRLTSANVRTTYATAVRSERYYQAESETITVASWFRENSQSLVVPFTRDEFYTLFERTAPTIGNNDNDYQVETKIKLAGSNDSAILTNDGSLATSTFITTSNIADGSSYNAVSEFSSVDYGDTSVRVTLIDAIAEEPASDFGSPPNPDPETDFYPVYRIDTMTGTDQGSHVYGYFFGSLVSTAAIGFYGRDFVEARQLCDSYISEDGVYSAGSKRAKCPVGSDGTVSIHQNETVYGSVQTNGSISASSPWGGDVCADFTGGCPNPGEQCEGSSCGVPGLPSYEAWGVYCPTDQGSVTVNANTTFTIAADTPLNRCWNTVTIRSNKTLTLTSTTVPYYINALSFQNNSNSVLNIQPDTAGGTVTLFVQNIAGNSFNGNQTFNLPNTPGQFVINYLGASDLTLNGTANMKAVLTAPNAGVNVSGTFDYFGSIQATDLTFTGNGDLHYDESLGGETVSDMNFTLRQLGQYYR